MIQRTGNKSISLSFWSFSGVLPQISDFSLGCSSWSTLQYCLSLKFLVIYEKLATCYKKLLIVDSHLVSSRTKILPYVHGVSGCLDAVCLFLVHDILYPWKGNDVKIISRVLFSSSLVLLVLLSFLLYVLFWTLKATVLIVYLVSLFVITYCILFFTSEVLLVQFCCFISRSRVLVLLYLLFMLVLPGTSYTCVAPPVLGVNPLHAAIRHSYCEFHGNIAGELQKGFNYMPRKWDWSIRRLQWWQPWGAQCSIK